MLLKWNVSYLKAPLEKISTDKHRGWMYLHRPHLLNSLAHITQMQRLVPAPYTLITSSAGCGPHGWPRAASHWEVGPFRRTAAYTSLSLQPAWYQHTEASGQRLPDTDAAGVPPSPWLSGTTVISRDICPALRISYCLPLNLNVLAKSPLCCNPGLIYQSRQ